jgi:hypothetical protein
VSENAHASDVDHPPVPSAAGVEATESYHTIAFRQDNSSKISSFFLAAFEEDGVGVTRTFRA